MPTLTCPASLLTVCCFSVASSTPRINFLQGRNYRVTVSFHGAKKALPRRLLHVVNVFQHVSSQHQDDCVCSFNESCSREFLQSGQGRGGSRFAVYAF